MEYSTSKEDFELFKRSCEKILKALGLNDIDVYYMHKADSEDAMANYTYQYQSSKAVLFLAECWNIKPTERLIKEQAIHEVSHLLLGRLSAQARDRSFVEEEYNAAEHHVINRLIKVLYKELENEHE
jgi:aryl-alcohol dehydrogenase-like predicted oxidoreductase